MRRRPLYVPILTRKPGALRNGAPFKGWRLPDALGRLRTRLAGHDDGDRQFVTQVGSAPWKGALFQRVQIPPNNCRSGW